MIVWCCYMLFTFYSFLSLLLFLQMFMLLNCGAKIVQTERLSSLCEAKIVQTERKSIKLACMFCWGAAYPRCFAANIQKFYGLHPIFRDVTKRTDHHNSKLVSSTAIIPIQFPKILLPHQRKDVGWQKHVWHFPFGPVFQKEHRDNRLLYR